MKVLVVTESYWPNADGGALFERRLVLGLCQKGHEMSVWAPGPRFSSSVEQDGPYQILRERSVTFFANRKYRVSFFPLFKARQVIRRQRPDVIHIHNCYWMGVFTMLWARRYHIPVVATNHFMPENALMNLSGLGALNRPLERLIWSFLVWFHNRANYVTSPTPTAVKLLVDHGLRVPAEAISNGIDTAVFWPDHDAAEIARVRTQYGIASDRPVLLYVGRTDGEKRIDLIIAALPEILQQQPAQLVIAGFGKELTALKAQANKLGVASDIVFTGFIAEEDKPLLYNTANVFVIASPAELQSIVTLEAMASALPVVAVDVAALGELCHDGANGYLFPRDNYRELAKRVNQIFANKALQKQFQTESTKIVQSSHSTEVTFNHYETAYQRAIGGTV